MKLALDYNTCWDEICDSDAQLLNNHKSVKLDINMLEMPIDLQNIFVIQIMGLLLMHRQDVFK
jgi:hypothetical protein